MIKQSQIKRSRIITRIASSYHVDHIASSEVAGTVSVSHQSSR